MKLRLLIGLFLCFAMGIHAQEKADERKQLAIDQIIELLSEQLEVENLDFTTLLDDLNYLYDHPVNLNRASEEELSSIYALNEFQIRNLQRHIAQTGNLISIYELQGIEGFDATTIDAILPFVKVADRMDRRVLRWEDIRKEGTHEAFVRWQRVLEEAEGFSPIEDSLLAENPNRRYLGSPDRLLTRYRFRYLNNISAGLTLEKDAGEALQLDGANTVDFYSAHIYFGNYGIIRHAIVGDFQAQFGQGLNFWTGLAFGKSSDIGSIKRTAREITPYTSADENNFMRGAATTLDFGNVELTAFYSRKRVDANLITADTFGNDLLPEFSSFQSSGFHRTPSELDDKDAIEEMNTGGHLRYTGDQFQVGVTGVYTNYFGSFQPNTALYRTFEPTSESFLVAGADYQFLLRNILIFGEFSQHSEGGTAFLNGAIISVDPRLDISIYHRDFSPSYSNPRSNAVSEGSRNTNERGFYIGMTARFNPKWTLRAYHDLFTFPWLRFRTDAPSRGNEFFAQLEYKPNKKVLVYGRYRLENKEENITIDEQPTRDIGTLGRQWGRINLQYSLSKSLSIGSRVEYTGVRLPAGGYESGWLVYQDIAYKPWASKYSIRLRYAMFDSESFQSRIYAYEHDVLYAFSIPAYYHRGSRFYIVAGYDITRWSDLTVRLAQTYFSNRDESGSGLNIIDGPTRTEVKVQLRVRF